MKNKEAIIRILKSFDEKRINFDTATNSILILIEGHVEHKRRQKRVGSDGGYSKHREETGQVQGLYGKKVLDN